MRKIIAFTCLTFLLSTAAAIEVRAQIFGGDEFVEGVGTNGIDAAHIKIFGRHALPNEINYWSKQSLEDTAQLIGQLKLWLQKPKGANELKETINRSYKRSFGRAPTVNEFGYWQSEVKAKQYGYSDLVYWNRQHLKSAEGANERVALTARAYRHVFGREPKPNETQYWSNEIQQKGENFSDLVKANIDWMLGSSPEQLNELQATILRAYAALKKSPPSEPQMKNWMAQVSAKRLTYDNLIKLI